jgi:hypothetical protein
METLFQFFSSLKLNCRVIFSDFSLHIGILLPSSTQGKLKRIQVLPNFVFENDYKCPMTPFYNLRMLTRNQVIICCILRSLDPLGYNIVSTQIVLEPKILKLTHKIHLTIWLLLAFQPHL